MVKIYSCLVWLLLCSNGLLAQEVLSKTEKEGLQVAYFASGCFWCVEAIYESVDGVKKAVSGYSGGHTKNPTYRSTGTGKTGHAETVAVYYDPETVSYRSLVEVYFGSQDVATYGQSPDFGSAYRSLIFYQNEKEEEIANRLFAYLNETVYDGKMVTEIVPFEKFHKAEAYHQNFEKRNSNHPYIQQVSLPRLNRFKNKFPELIKK
jgi:peptide-methionine (S)-S-oxide reductase